MHLKQAYSVDHTVGKMSRTEYANFITLLESMFLFKLAVNKMIWKTYQ